MAAESGVEMWEHTVIYRIPEDVSRQVESATPKIVTQRVSGEAEIAATFEITVRVGTTKAKRIVAGCKVRNGMVKKGSKVRVLRNGKTVYEGTVLHCLGMTPF